MHIDISKKDAVFLVICNEKWYHGIQIEVVHQKEG